MPKITVNNMGEIRAALSASVSYAEGLSLIIDFAEFKHDKKNFTELNSLLTSNGAESIALEFTEKSNLAASDVQNLYGLPADKIKSFSLYCNVYAEPRIYVEHCQKLFDSLGCSVEVNLHRNIAGGWKKTWPAKLSAEPRSIPSAPGDSGTPLLEKTADAVVLTAKHGSGSYTPPKIPDAAGFIP